MRMAFLPCVCFPFVMLLFPGCGGGGRPSPPPKITTQPTRQQATEGQTASFRVEATGTEPLTYAWSRNGAVIPGSNPPV